MRKKIFLLFILLLCLSSCGHEHLYYDTYNSNAEEHWRESRCEHDVKIDIGEHTFSDWVVTLEPTEESRGMKERKCTVCEWKENEYIDELEHVHAIEEVVIDPTCEEEGYKICSCACGYYDEIVLEKLEHELEEHLGKFATCTTSGYKPYVTCKNCDYTTYEEIPMLSHSIVYHEGKEATCTNVGYRAYQTCEMCNYTTYKEIASKGHDITKYDGKEATCTENGYKPYESCKNCSYSTYEVIYTQGHSIVYHDAKNPTCTEVGHKAYQTCENCDYNTYEEIDVIDHEMECVDWHYECGEKSYECFKCINCDYEYINEYYYDHSYGYEVINYPTIETEGLYQYVCFNCRDVIEEWTLPAFNFNDYVIDYIDENVNTCLEDFYVFLVYELDEYNFFGFEVYFDALGHEIRHYEAKEATCEEDGYYAYEACSRCEYNTYEPIYSTGHKYGEWELELEPTKTETGRLIRTCSNDNTHIDEYILPILSNEKYNVYSEDATCTEDGVILYQKYIGTYLYVYEDVKPALGHEEVMHEAKDATCTDIGWKNYVTCTRCNYTTYEEISALNHDIVNHEGLAPTCESNGYNPYDTCTRCSYTTYFEIDNLGHKYNLGNINEPTKETMGSVDLICSNDDTHIKTVDLPIFNEENYEITIIEPALCLTPGLASYVIYIEEFKIEFEVVLDALGHDLVYFEETNSTCKVNGHNAYEACIRCDYSTKVEKELLEHIEVIDELVEPTKDTTGLTEGSHCEVCCEVINPQKVLYYFDVIYYNEELGEEVEYEHIHLAGDEIELNAKPDEGRGIAGWYLNGILYSEELNITFIMPSGNTTLELRYTIYPNMDIWFGDIASSFESGDGTVDNPYIIKYASQFAYFERMINQNESEYNEYYYELVKSIDFNGFTFNTIANDTNFKNRFEGSFNGNDCILYNLKLKNNSDTAVYGLFGAIYGATIKNLKFDTATINVNDVNTKNEVKVGILLGHSHDKYLGKMTIENIEMININITATTKNTVYVGAVLGYSDNSSSSIFKNCKVDNVTISVTSEKDAYVGTISGKCIAGISGISGSGNINATTNKEAYVGGLIGCTSVESTINNIAFEGDINVISKIDSSTNISDVFVGGLFGYASRLTINNANVTSNFTINCVNKGDVSVGGLIGYSSAASVTDGIKVNSAEVRGNITVENANNVIAAGLVTSSGKVTDASYTGEVKIYADNEVDFVGISNGYSVEKSSVNSNILIETEGYISSIGITSNRAKNCYFNGTMELKSDYKVFASGILGEGDYAINCYSTGNINITAGYKYSYSVVATGIALGYNSAPDIQSCFTDLCIVVKNSNGDSYIICRVSHRCDEFINNYYSLEQYCTFNDVFAECEDEGNLSCVERKDVDSTFFTDELGWSTEVWDFSNEYPTLKD